MYVTDGFTDRSSPSEKLLSVIYGLSMSPLAINITMDLQTDKLREKNLPAIFRRYIYR
jgi:hypothetical protein